MGLRLAWPWQQQAQPCPFVRACASKPNAARKGTPAHVGVDAVEVWRANRVNRAPAAVDVEAAATVLVNDPSGTPARVGVAWSVVKPKRHRVRNARAWASIACAYTARPDVKDCARLGVSSRRAGQSARNSRNARACGCRPNFLSKQRCRRPGARGHFCVSLFSCPAVKRV